MCSGASLAAPEHFPTKVVPRRYLYLPIGTRFVGNPLLPPRPRIMGPPSLSEPGCLFGNIAAMATTLVISSIPVRPQLDWQPSCSNLCVETFLVLCCALWFHFAQCSASFCQENGLPGQFRRKALMQKMYFLFKNPDPKASPVSDRDPVDVEVQRQCLVRISGPKSGPYSGVAFDSLL